MTREGDLEAIRVQGKRIRTALLEVRHLASPLRRPRVGVIVPRFGHTAVDRNLVKRRLRDLARTEVLLSIGAIDVVIRASPAAYKASFDELQRAVRGAVRKLQRNDTELTEDTEGTEKNQ